MVSTHQRNSSEEFLEERRLSSFHFLLPFFSGLMFNSSHLSRVEQMVTDDRVDTNHESENGDQSGVCSAYVGIFRKREKKDQSTTNTRFLPLI